MTPVKAYAAFVPYTPQNPLQPYEFERRAVGPHDVQIDILYCGVCHSDLHTVNGDWGEIPMPIVPGHEIIGRVEKVGEKVQKFKVGDTVGVGCFVDSCRTCDSCREGLEQYCENGALMTYGSKDPRGGITQGGYSTKIVVDENYVLRVPTQIPLERAAPLLCAGITTYSPLRHWNIKKGDRVAIAGLGGLGHMGVKFAVSFGAEVTVLSTSEKKKEDALKLGAHKFINMRDEEQLRSARNDFDFILNTISAPHDYNTYLSLLRRDGTMVLVGLPEPQVVGAFSLVPKRRRLAGSLIGGIAETQEMLDYCGQHEISADVEVIRMEQINEAYERMIRGDVRYRFVIDLQSLK